MEFEGKLEYETHKSKCTLECGGFNIMTHLLNFFLTSLQEQRPIYSFEVTGDYIYDVAWSPIHPSVFADVDGNGRLNLWNLNNDTELPSATVQVDGPAALNRVSWTQSGLHVTAGDDMGKIWVYDVGEVQITQHET